MILFCVIIKTKKLKQIFYKIKKDLKFNASNLITGNLVYWHINCFITYN